MGMLLCRSLRDSGIPVTLIDSRPHTTEDLDGVTFVQSDIAEFQPALNTVIASSACVCVCLPEKITLQVVSRLTEMMADGSLWVDTLSVKSGIVRALQEQPGRFQSLSINPMFAPVMGWRGGAVAVIEVVAGPKSVFLRQLLHTWGARLETISAEEHDHLTAVIQVATHAAVLSFGGALLHLNFDLERALRLATPPHRLLLTLLHRMTTQNAGVYWDIQACHPLGERVRKELIGVLQRIQTDAGKQESSEIIEIFFRFRKLFEGRDELLMDWARYVFALPSNYETPLR
jgi:prephenate dehydrogenase